MDLSASQQSVKAWLEKWLEAKRGSVKSSTWAFYERHCAYMVDHIGYIKLEALEAHHVRAMLAALAKAGSGAAVVRARARRVARGAQYGAERPPDSGERDRERR
jgi:hypothetical protein